MTRRRAAAAAGLAGVALLLLGDYLIPFGNPAPPVSAEPTPVAALLPRLPARNVGRFGKEGDPLNLVFLGRADEVVGALREAGWTRIPVRIPAALREALRELATAGSFRAFPPMNFYRLNGRFQDLNWSQPITPVSKRHHFRLWRTGLRDEKGRELWWGSGNLDIGVRWWSLSHIPDPDMDGEREHIAATLAGSRWVESLALAPTAQVPREGVNDKGHAFRTDGRVLVVTLKPAAADSR